MSYIFPSFFALSLSSTGSDFGISCSLSRSPESNREWISKFSEKGYSSLIVEIDPDSITNELKSTRQQQVLSSLEQGTLSLSLSLSHVK